MIQKFKKKGRHIFVLIVDICAFIAYFGFFYGFLFLIVYGLYMAREPIHNVELYSCQPEHVSGFVEGVGEIVQISGSIVVEVGWPDPIDPFVPIPPGEARVVSGVPEQFRHRMKAMRLTPYKGTGYSGVWTWGEGDRELQITKRLTNEEGLYRLTFSGVHGPDRLRVYGPCVRTR